MPLALFDWDGTIVDSIDRHFDAYAVVCRRFDLPFDREIFRCVYAPDWRLMYRRLGMPDDSIEEAGRAWQEAFAGNEAPPFAGAAAALERLSAAGYALGLVTGGHRAVIRPQLVRFGLAHLFPVRVFGDERIAGKPDPAPLELAIRRAGRLAARDGRAVPLLPGATVYVGDALDDMRMAAAAGVHGVGIVSGLASADELVAAGAVETVPSLAAWVERRLAKPAVRV